MGIRPNEFFGQRMKVCGQLWNTERSFSIRRWWTKESWQDVSSFGRQRERPWKNMLLRKRSEEQLPHVPGRYPLLCVFYRHHPGKRAATAMRGRFLGPTALIGPHGRSGWCVRFGGRASLCATEHMCRVTPEEADCLGLDERRQLDELLGQPGRYRKTTRT